MLIGLKIVGTGKQPSHLYCRQICLLTSYSFAFYLAVCHHVHQNVAVKQQVFSFVQVKVFMCFDHF